MNYIAEMNSFYDWKTTNKLQADAQALWSILMNINSRCAVKHNEQWLWRAEFTVSNQTLLSILEFSRQQLDRMRNLLIQLRRIVYIKGKGSSCGIYQIVPFGNYSIKTINGVKYREEFEKHNVTQPDTQAHEANYVTQPDTQPVTQPDTQMIHDCYTNENLCNINGTLINNNKQVKSNNKTPHTPPNDDEPSERSPVDGRFEEFWSTYPKKTDKGEAERIYKRIKPTKQLQDQIISAVEKSKQSEQWKRNNGQYIPMPSTWLNKKRWEDEIEVDKNTNDYTKFEPSKW